MPQLTAAYIARKCERLKSGQAFSSSAAAPVPPFPAQPATASDLIARKLKAVRTKAVDDESIVSARAALAQSTIDASAAEERLQLQQRFVLLLRIKRARASLRSAQATKAAEGTAPMLFASCLAAANRRRVDSSSSYSTPRGETAILVESTQLLEQAARMLGGAATEGYPVLEHAAALRAADAAVAAARVEPDDDAAAAGGADHLSLLRSSAAAQAAATLEASRAALLMAERLDL